MNNNLLKRRTNKYSSGKLYTQYLKICKGCDKESWMNRKNSIFCSRECCNIYLRRIDNPLEYFFREKITRLKSNAKNRKKDFNLNWKDLLEKYDNQKGLCYYTSIKMELFCDSSSEKICFAKQLSVDRLDSTKGYFKENIVLCLFCINNFKGEMSLLEFKEIINNIKLNEF